uniref:CSON004120 protein n=1 Tax=Culicoides sonorensis TaxID=179676 RepID=A0A336LTF7_CULSO
MKFTKLETRLTGCNSCGDRIYQEDAFTVSLNKTKDDKEQDPNWEYLFIGVFDGHGGHEASKFAKEHLEQNITSNRLFWSDRDKDVLKAIREGFLQTHNAMWKAQENWPRTHAGFYSTAGTTASIAFIKNGKLFVGHVGDSKIVLGMEHDHHENWISKELTIDHKPESPEERKRIMESGGKVVAKAGVPRVVWNRPKAGQKGRQLRNTKTDEIPFLAIARSLGDLWSYNSQTGQFVVSPDPDLRVYNLVPGKHKCLIFGTDGLWNVMSAQSAVQMVSNSHYSSRVRKHDWKNPSKTLVDEAIKRWAIAEKRADNVSVVTLILTDDEDMDEDEEEEEESEESEIYTYESDPEECIYTAEYYEKKDSNVQFLQHEDTSLYESIPYQHDDTNFTPEYEDISHMAVDEDCETLKRVKNNGSGIFPKCVMRQYQSTSTTFERFNYIES